MCVDVDVIFSSGCLEWIGGDGGVGRDVMELRFWEVCLSTPHFGGQKKTHTRDFWLGMS